MKCNNPIRSVACFVLALFPLLIVPVASASTANADLPNFHTVVPGIYRGAAPTYKGLQELKSLGIKTDIDLRISPRLVAKEKIQAQQLGLVFINLPMGADPPTPREVKVLLSTLNQAPSQPVFVHCQHGADRTGCMIGIYRETQQGWPFATTFVEMKKYGFNPRWTKLTAAVQQRATH